MLTKIIVCLVIAAIIVGGAFLLGHFGIWPFGSGSGDGDGDGTINSPISNPEESQDIIVTERPQTFLIEIKEDKIIFDNDEVSLNEMENILQKYEALDDAWTLEDSYRADKYIYDEVRALLVKYDIIFRER